MTGIFRTEIHDGGVLVATMDAPGQAMNVIGDDFMAEFADLVAAIRDNEAVRGAVITSGKAAFAAGADLKLLEAEARAASRSPDVPLRDFGVMSRLYRQLETCAKPVAAAINGTALGGGYEICLACHYRVAADDPAIQIGLPEVKVGLLPGGGGTQRLSRLVGIERAVPLMLAGSALNPRDALAQGLIDAVVPRDGLIEAAVEWVRGQKEAVQPWDRKGFLAPGGTAATSLAIANFLSVQTAGVQRQGNRNFPAPLAILSAVFEGTIVPFDKGVEIEQGYFRSLFRSPVAANMIRTNFLSKGDCDRLIHRPQGIAKSRVAKLGILGAGMMGAGIAHVAAEAGIEVVLIDRDDEAAARGKAYSQKLFEKLIARGAKTAEAAQKALARITPTTDYGLLKGADFIVEAVFEDRGVKADVTRRAAAVAPEAIFASNTSTLPITGLATAWPAPDRFIGTHFFSPVDRMPLVEIIRGAQTSDETLARALDFARQIRKTPIQVHDSRGFFTSRVFRTYLDEGEKMVMDGVSPARIEHAGRFAGMPVGPLALQDEVSLDLSISVRNQTRDDLGNQYQPTVGEPVMDLVGGELGRLGRKNGKGFYDYFADGTKALWPGLAQYYPVAADQPPLQELAKRILYVQAVETVRCLEEGVLDHVIDADVGAVLGWGFASHTGGPVSLIDTIGVSAFAAECERMAALYGPRFAPPKLLLRQAEAGQGFYDRLMRV